MVKIAHLTPIMSRRSNMDFFQQSRAGNSKENSAMWPSFELIWDFMVVSWVSVSFIKIRSNLDFFSMQGQITLYLIVWSGQMLNWFKILCISWLPASLTKIQSKVEADYRVYVISCYLLSFLSKQIKIDRLRDGICSYWGSVNWGVMAKWLFLLRVDNHM